MFFSKKTILTMLMFFFLAGIVFLDCDSKKTIRIGFIAGTSGRVADLGIAGLDAVQLAVEEWNQRGGIKGREIRLIVKDDRQNPEIARRAVQELINEGVAAVIGPMTSDMGMVMAPILGKERILNISPTVTTDLLSGIDDYFFCITPTARVNAAISAGYQIKTGNMTRIAAIYDASNSSFTENWLEDFKELFVGDGREIITSIPFNNNENKSFSEIAMEALSFDIDGILIITNSIDSALLCQQIRKIDKKMQITLADCAIDRLIELGGKAVEGITVVQIFDRDNPNPKYQEFRKAYIKRYSREPDFPGVHTYNAANVLLTILKSQKKGQDLKEVILSIRQFEGLLGIIRFDDFGDIKQSNASMGIIRNRKFVPVE